MTKEGIKTLGTLFVIGALVSSVGCERKALRSAPLPAAVAVDQNGNRVVVGTFRDQFAVGPTTLHSAGGSDIFVARVSRTGVPIWTPERYGGVGDDTATSVAIAPDGTVVIGGTFEETLALGEVRLEPINTPGGDRKKQHGVFVAKLSPAGKPIWATLIGKVDSPANVTVSVQANGAIVAGVALSGSFEVGQKKGPALEQGVLAIDVTADGRVASGPMLLAGLLMCAHSACGTGVPLNPACDPTGCVGTICAVKDHNCCADGGAWTPTCAGYVGTVCNKRCDTDLCRTSNNAVYIDADPPCTETVYGVDSHCCKTKWDTACVHDLVASCGISCSSP